MTTKAQESRLADAPAGALSLLVAFSSLFIIYISNKMISIVLAFMHGAPLGQTGVGSEQFIYLLYGIFIAVTCYFICKAHPRSVWYAPIICNVVGIIAAFIEPTFWETSIWVVFATGWVMSAIAAIIGSVKGRQTI